MAGRTFRLWWWVAAAAALAGCAEEKPVRQKAAVCTVTEKSPIKEYLRVDGNVVLHAKHELATLNELGEIEGYGKTSRTIGRFSNDRLTYLAAETATSERIHDRVVRIKIGGRQRTFFYSGCKRAQAALGVAAWLFKEEEGL